MKKQILFFQNQSNNLSERTKSLSKTAITFMLFMCFTTLSFGQTIVDCSAGPLNTTYCYVNNDTTQFVFTSTGGFPLNVFFNAGQVEVNFDELIVLDSDGVTNLNAATPYGNNGDLTGITYQSSGDTITIQIDSDSVISCETNAFTPWDFDIWCQTCINPTVTFSTDGDCTDGSDFSILVDISDMGSATELYINDDQGSPQQSVTTTGIVTFGPYTSTTDVIMTVNDANDINCEVTSNLISCLSGGPGSLFINAGDDISLECDGDGCTDITASFLATFESLTENYTVDPITYEPPYAFNGLANSINTNIDDAWSPVEALPFDFCFFENIETQFQVGSNGVIRFDVDANDTGIGSNAWSFDADVPNNTEDALAEANVFTPVHDIDPSVNDANEIAWEILGTFPNRVLVVSYYEVPMFSGGCNNLLATHMAVFYEFSNVIEIYMQDKPACDAWNDGNAAVGIQNDAGNIGYVPPGRNTSDSPWTATNEAWSFTPAGEQTYVFEWLDSNGDFISNDPTINVCPDGEETYTAQITYTNCNGDVVVLTDEITVTLVATFSVDLGEDQELCDETSYDITAEVIDGNPDDATFEWSTGEDTQTITVTSSGDYSVDVTIDGCTLTQTVNVLLEESPVFDLGEDFSTCFELEVLLDASPSNMDPANVTYEWSLDGNILAGETSATIIITQLGTYSAVVSAGNCSSEDSIIINPSNDLGVELGEDFNTCFINSVILDATPAIGDINTATYEWSLDGVILSETTATLNATAHGTYFVSVTIGVCIDTDNITLLPLIDLGVELGNDFTTCFNTPVFLDASPSIGDPNNATFEWSLDGVLLSDTTATLDATEHGNYSVTVNLFGCSDTDSIALTPLGDLGVDLGGNIETCFDEQLILDATPSLGDPADTTYLWSFDGVEFADETSSTLNATQYGVYSVVVSIGECSDEDSMTTTGRDDLFVSLGNNVQTCPDMSVTLAAITDEEGVSYQWSLDDTVMENQTSATLEASEVGTYTVTIRTGECTGSSSVEVYYYDNENCVISQGLSPHNYDGYNDYLDLSFLDDRSGISNFQVFNRLGAVVYNRDSYRKEWTGQSNADKILPTGTYYYVIDFDSEDPVYGNQATGWVYVNREEN